MGDVIVTDAKTIPAASDNEILVVEQYPGIPKPTNRLANGIYYSFKKVWYNFSKYLVPNSRTITINGDTKDLSENRDWTVDTGAIDSVADTNTVNLNIDVNKELTADVRYQNTSDIDLSDDVSGLKADLTVTGVTAATYGDASNIPQLTVDSKGRITNAVDIPITIPSVTPSALTRTNDTNVTLTLNGTPATALLQAVELVVGWTGTLADSRITSAATWNAKEPAITWAQGDLLYGTGVNTYSKLAKDTNATRYLSNTGASNNPAWAQVDLTDGVTGILPGANGGSLVLLSTATASSSSSIDFEVDFTVYKKYIIEYTDVQVSTNFDDLWLRVGTGSPVAYKSGANDYTWVRRATTVTSTGVIGNSGGGTYSDTKVSLAVGGNNTGVYSANGNVEIYNPSGSTYHKNLIFHGAVRSVTSLGVIVSYYFGGAGTYRATTPITGLRIMASTGNILTGTFKIYGVA